MIIFGLSVKVLVKAKLRPNIIMDMNEILAKIESLGGQVYGGGSLLEDVQILTEVKVGPNAKLEKSKFDRMQLVVTEGGRTAYFGIQSVKKNDTYVQPKAAKYSLVVRKVKAYGEKTRQWLEDNGISPENFQPGQIVLHARA